jgi:hypothetical protein
MAEKPLRAWRLVRDWHVNANEVHGDEVPHTLPLDAITGQVGRVRRVRFGWAYAIYGVLLFAWLVWVAITLRRLGTTER